MPVFDVYDAKPPRRIVADEPRVTLGRTDDNTILVDDRLASRQHCEIRHSDAGYVLRDLQSRNGTLLNQYLIDHPVTLKNGDEIGIGAASIRFWFSRNHIDKTAPKLPLVRQSPSPAKPNPPDDQPRPKPARPARRHPAPKAQPAAAHDTDQGLPPRPADQNEQIKLITDELPASPAAAAGSSEPLTLHQVIPLNYEGKPAHPVGRDNTEVSQAMLHLKQLLLKSFELRATDIHLEPREGHLDVRYRVDGYLHRLGAIYPQIARPIYSIIKLLCNLDINKKNIMQDGSFAVQLPDRRVDLRVSIAPSTLGDKVVLRLLDKNLAPEGLGSLGMDPYILEQVRKRTQQESCMLIVCGPTGSGKTTTVYAIIQEMDTRSLNVVTVEDPVEFKLDNVTQIQVNPKFNIAFVSALASLLRQDPDVILVGEIRDAQTAQMAVRSAMTGHLVLSTVHARDSIGCIFRLLDLGVEPFLLGSALSAILSQRLLRRLCPLCKMKFKPALKELARLGLEELAGQQLFAAVGCHDCLNLGYKGRLAVFEMLAITDQVRDAIVHKPSIHELRVAAGDWIFQTLREDALRRIKTGLTSLEEFTSIAVME